MHLHDYLDLLKGDLTADKDFTEVQAILKEIEHSHLLIEVVQRDLWCDRLLSQAQKHELFYTLTLNTVRKEEHFKLLIIDLVALISNLIAKVDHSATEAA